MKNGRIIHIQPEVRNNHLIVTAEVENGETKVRAILPQRETATLVPRYILLGKEKQASHSLLLSISTLLLNFTIGRKVRLYEYQGVTYCGFLDWRSVKFT
ncbi:MAG: hypothetical protein KAU17_04775 [Spirochaetales bacterium]|jgi:hypothetical protein|nr:hypothetical protein [Spirochaetales bacterium]